ncbi:MAG: hypothetical protein ACI8PT_000899 [Gammaproteobacteria bacterium]|jgi:hypothetical protein
MRGIITESLTTRSARVRSAGVEVIFCVVQLVTCNGLSPRGWREPPR